MEEKINGKMRIFFITFLLFFIVLSLTCIEELGKDKVSKEKNINEFISSPQENISGYILMWHVYGDYAIKELYKMHSFSKELRKLKNASIMVYHKKDNVAYIWLGVAENEESAEDMIKRMEEIISKNKTPYKIAGKFKVGNVNVIHAVDMKGHHYFFYIKREAVWIYLKENDLPFVKEFIDIIKRYS